MFKLVVAVVMLLAVAVMWARSQPTAPTSLPGCVYNSSLPTLGNGQTQVLQCNSSGQLLLH